MLVLPVPPFATEDNQLFHWLPPVIVNAICAANLQV